MAKLSVILRNKKRELMAKNQFERRAQYKDQALDTKLSEEDRVLARKKLQALPRNGSRTRVVSRCVLTGRGAGAYRKSGLSRIKFRELALMGKIPGVTKASW